MVKTVVFAINTLGGGGAESHTLRVMNHLDRERYRPVLAVTRPGGNYEQFVRGDVPIETISLAPTGTNAASFLTSPVPLASLVRKYRPAMVLPVMDPLAVLGIPTLLAFGRGRPKIVPIIQAPPSIAQADTFFGRSVVLPGVRHLFQYTDRIIALSRGVRDDLVRLNPRLSARVTVIHNACVDERIEEQEVVATIPQTDAPVIVAAGRLAPQKDYPTLLDAFVEVRDKTGAELWILGEGRDQPAIEAQIARLGIGKSVRLLGFQRDPQAFMRRATVFCLSSVFEGFGNVIVEAMACGAPVVSTDCPHGPNEIITPDKDGLLVPVRDPVALATALVRILRDDVLRDRIAQAGKERASAFHAKVIAEQYADEMDRIVESPTSSSS